MKRNTQNTSGPTATDQMQRLLEISEFFNAHCQWLKILPDQRPKGFEACRRNSIKWLKDFRMETISKPNSNELDSFYATVHQNSLVGLLVINLLRVLEDTHLHGSRRTDCYVNDGMLIDRPAPLEHLILESQSTLVLTSHHDIFRIEDADLKFLTGPRPENNSHTPFYDGVKRKRRKHKGGQVRGPKRR